METDTAACPSGRQSYTEMIPKELVKRLYALQEERVETYKLFEEGFQAYLNGAPNYNFQMYRQLVHEITQAFNKMSEDILSVQSAISEKQKMNRIATIVSKIQNEEGKKLELTAKLQISRQNNKDHPNNDEYSNDIAEYKKCIQEVVGQIVGHLEDLKYESEDLYDEELSDACEADR